MQGERTPTATSPLDDRVHLVKEVFCEVTGAVQADDDADFFAMGGHSLLVIEAIGVLRERHGLHVPARQFFRDAGARAVAAACVPLEEADDGAPGAGPAAER